MPYKTSMNINSNIFLAIKPSNAKLNQKSTLFKSLNYNPIQHLQFLKIQTNPKIEPQENYYLLSRTVDEEDSVV